MVIIEGHSHKLYSCNVHWIATSCFLLEWSQLRAHTVKCVWKVFPHRHNFNTCLHSVDTSSAGFSSSLLLMRNTLVCLKHSLWECTWQIQAAKRCHHPYLDWCALECKSLHTTQEHDYGRTFAQKTRLQVLWIAAYNFYWLLLELIPNWGSHNFHRRHCIIFLIWARFPFDTSCSAGFFITLVLEQVC